VSAVVYEVNLEVAAGAIDAYRAWLAEHVAEIVALPGFTGATTWDVADPPAPEGTVRLCVQYRLDGMPSLEAYLRDHAPRLRAEGIARFGDQVRATRRVLAGTD
jgi:hypothetical protein